MASRRSWLQWMVCLPGISVLLTGRESKQPGKALQSPTFVRSSSPKCEPIQVRDGEKSSGFTPIVAFEILDSVQVANVRRKTKFGNARY